MLNIVFMHLLAICMSLEKYFKSIAYFSIGLSLFLCYSSSFYMLDTRPLWRYMICKYFLLLYGLFLIISFEAQMFLILMKLNFSTFSLNVLLLSYLNNRCLIQSHEELAYMFSSKSFSCHIYTAHIFWFHFCIWCQAGVQLHSLA